MKKRLLALSTLMLASAGVFGQQDMALTHFIYNKMTFNPGAAGMEDGICGTLLYRNQWDRVNGAPNSAVFNAEANLDAMGIIPAGVGLAFAHDAIGFNRSNTLLLNYAHHLNVGTAGELGIGVGLGILNFGNSPTWVPPNTLTDPLLPAGGSATVFDLNFGLYWKGNVQPYYIGLSATHLAEPDLEQKSLISSNTNTSYTAARHYYAMGGYVFQGIGGSNGDLDVQAMMRTDMVKYSVDLNARYIFNKMLYGGLTYRTSDAIAVMAGFMREIPDPSRPGRIGSSFVAGYSYDLTINQLSSVSNGTHELLVKYCYFIPPPPKHPSLHPRWL